MKSVSFILWEKHNGLFGQPNSYQSMKSRGGTLNACCQVKVASVKRLHTCGQRYLKRSVVAGRGMPRRSRRIFRAMVGTGRGTNTNSEPSS